MKMKKKTAVKIIRAIDAMLLVGDYASVAVFAVCAGLAAYWLWSVA